MREILDVCYILKNKQNVVKCKKKKLWKKIKNGNSGEILDASFIKNKKINKMDATKELENWWLKNINYAQIDQIWFDDINLRE